MNSLLSTKTQIPHTFGRLIERPRLLHSLDRILDVPLTLLAAPAGFGKTTLLCQWIAQRRKRTNPSVRTAWLSLDEQDGDLQTFLTYVIAALRTVSPDACATTKQFLFSSDMPSDQALVVSFVNELGNLYAEREPDAREHLVLVLDDYHLVNNDAVNSLLTAILRHPQPHLHLVVNCRHDPTLPLARLRTEHRLLELRSKDLRLNRDEIQQVLRQAAPIDWSPSQVTALDERTEGWPAGLQLIALTVQDRTDAERVVKMAGHPQQHVMNFLMEEVMARLPADMQKHVIEISTLHQFSAGLCEAVCDDMQEAGTEFISALEHSNLFLIGLDDTGTWFRFHHLFRELLQHQLKQRFDGAGRAALHKRAMDWFVQTSSIDQALVHAFAAGEFTAAAELVAKHRHRLMNYEEWQRLARWLGMFSNEVIAQFPDLLLTRAWLARIINFDLVVSGVLAQQAANLLDAKEPPFGNAAALRAEVDLFRAMHVYRTEANAHRVIKLAARAMEMLPPEWSMVRMHGAIFLAAGFQLQGELAQALQVLHAAQTEELLSDYAARARAFRSEAMIQWMEGNLPAMLEAAKRSSRREGQAEYSETDAWAHYFIAAVYYERNELAAAEAHADITLNDPNSWSNFRPAVDCALILALVYQARNLPERAREVLEDALGWALEKHSDALVVTIRAFQAQLALRQGDMAAANRWHAGFGNPTAAGTMPNFSSPYLTAVQVLIAQNTPESRRQAAESLGRLKAHLARIHNTRFLIDTFALEALLHDQEGDSRRSLTALAHALVLAEPGGFIRPFVDLGEPIEKLLRALARRDGVSPYLAALLDAFGKTPVSPQPKPPAELLEPLSDRETQVLDLLAKRMSNKEIALELIISPLTVKAHTEHIYQKLGVNSRRDAVKRGEALGLFQSNHR